MEENGKLSDQWINLLRFQIVQTDPSKKIDLLTQEAF